MPNLKEYILTLHDAVPASLCDQILADHQSRWSPSKVTQVQRYTGGDLEKYIRSALRGYRVEFPTFYYDGTLEPCEVLRYPEGSHCVEHTDHISGKPRVLTCSIQLNDDFEGGKFRFFGEYTPPLRKGMALLFPSTFQYPHEVLPVRRGERYAVITWVW